MFFSSGEYGLTAASVDYLCCKCVFTLVDLVFSATTELCVCELVQIFFPRCVLFFSFSFLLIWFCVSQRCLLFLSFCSLFAIMLSATLPVIEFRKITISLLSLSTSPPVTRPSQLVRIIRGEEAPMP